MLQDNTSCKHLKFRKFCSLGSSWCCCVRPETGWGWSCAIVPFICSAYFASFYVKAANEELEVPSLIKAFDCRIVYELSSFGLLLPCSLAAVTLKSREMLITWPVLQAFSEMPVKLQKPLTWSPKRWDTGSVLNNEPLCRLRCGPVLCPESSCWRFGRCFLLGMQTGQERCSSIPDCPGLGMGTGLAMRSQLCDWGAAERLWGCPGFTQWQSKI